MTRDQAQMLTSGRDWRTPTFFRIFMPYVYNRVEYPGRKHAFLPLNRDYQPLGMRRVGTVDYQKVTPLHAVYFRRDPALLTGIWHSQRADMLWLYDDSTDSRMDYFERLERLLSLQQELVA